MVQNSPVNGLFRRGRRAAPAASTDPPDWFTTAVGQQPQHHTIEVADCPVHVRAWGDPDNPPLVFVHGGGAHSGWWDHIAPFFTGTHHVIAPDLSGHGDSGTRPSYAVSLWAREVLAAADVSRSSARPTIVGHSMGGWVTSAAAIRHGTDIDSVLIIDSPLRDRAPEENRLRNRRRDSPGYRSEDEIVSRFKAVPAQDVSLPYVAERIARQSVRNTEAGWVWKFDPEIFGGDLLAQSPAEQELVGDTFTRLPCRVGYLRCKKGIVAPDMADQIRSMLQLRGPFVELAEAGHHPMLDQPLPLVAAVRTLLEFWSIT